MSTALKVVGSVLGGPLLGLGIFAPQVASQLGAIAASIPGPHQPFAAAYAAVTGIYAQVTAPKPVAKGSATNVVIEAEPPRPYLMGEAFSAGVLRHQVGYGDELKKVQNPYLLQVKVFSSVGPVESLVGERFDFQTIGSYYTGFYDSDTQLGARPEASALVPPLDAPATGWDANSKLSGCAAIASNYLFDKDGKVFAGGLPNHGAIWRGEKVYDPRLDDTFPGGSGTHRLGDESTYTYSDNPALHAGTYLYGRYENSIKVFGVGLSSDAIDWDAIVDWANDCETNAWTVNGTIYEGGSDNAQTRRVGNLDDICAAGGGRWLIAGGQISFDWHRPRVSLDTLTDDDLLEGGITAIGLQTLRERMNGVRPQYVSPDHNWEQITADEIIGTTYRTEDGEPLTQTWPLNLVTDEDQAGELASYALADSREIGPIEVEVGQQWRFYKPGETLTLNSELIGYNGQAVIVQRTLDPATLAVRMTLKGETAAKHTFALGKTATPPPTPIIGQTGQQRDQVAGYLSDPRGAFRIRSYSPAFPITPGDGQIAITAFSGTLEDGQTISFPAETETGLAVSTFYAVFWDLVDEVYSYDTAPGTAKLESSRYVFVGSVSTSDSGTFPSPSTPPDGYSSDPNYQEP